MFDHRSPQTTSALAIQVLQALACVLSAMALTACTSTPAVGPMPPVSDTLSRPSEPTDIAASLTPEDAQSVTVYALGLVGIAYRYGGNTPDGGFDCSGLIHHVYRQQAGLSSPRTVTALKHWGQPVPREQLRTGDLVVFFQGMEANHAGIYVGDGRFVHAPSTGGRVRMDHLSNPYWVRQQSAYRRP